MLNAALQKQTLVAVLIAVPAIAADMGRPAAPAPPVAENPVEEVVAGVAQEQVFQDWRLACAAGACAIFTRIEAADGAEVLRVTVPGAGAPALRFSTPLGLHLPDGLVATFGAEDERRIPWRTCGPRTGCLADAALDPELRAVLRRERDGSATFTLEEGVPVRLGFSLMGFSAALAALAGVSPGP